MKPTISVITPSYNQARFIDKTIQSVLIQDIPDLEYLVLDNCSNDGTLDILNRYDKSLQWICEPDRGQAHAVNKGILATQGEIIAWLNSDDIYYPRALNTILSYFNEHPQLDVVYGDADHINELDQVIEAYYTEAWDFDRLMDVCFLSQPATFFRRRVVDQHGLLDENLKYCMDYEYWLRLAQEGAKFAYLPQKLAGSRLYAQTKTLGEKVKVHREINDMLKMRLGKVPDRWLFNYAHAILDTQGLARTKKFRFALAVSTLSLVAAIKWNRRVTSSMIVTTLRWIRGAIHLSIKGILEI